jgi:hypothetical protein
MGIDRIHILVKPDIIYDPQVTQVQIAVEVLIRDHQQGKHTYGRMYRACPLCHPTS